MKAPLFSQSLSIILVKQRWNCWGQDCQGCYYQCLLVGPHLDSLCLCCPLSRYWWQELHHSSPLSGPCFYCQDCLLSQPHCLRYEPPQIQGSPNHWVALPWHWGTCDGWQCYQGNQAWEGLRRLLWNMPNELAFQNRLWLSVSVIIIFFLLSSPFCFDAMI